MKNRSYRTFAIPALAVAAAGAVSAATRYVSLDSPNPTLPYATWETAARVIQDAVDAARAGDTVLVTNGVYAVGERDGNRVVITNAIRLESVNGPSVTTVDGGGSARCVYLGTNAVLSGFTLTNGGRFSARYGGGGVCSDSGSTVTNCLLIANRAEHNPAPGSIGGGRGGGAWNCTLYNSTLTGNSAPLGGGVSGSTLYNCTLSGNWAELAWNMYGPGFGQGGGAVESTLYNCKLIGNSAESVGGGALSCTLYNCTVTGNHGGGVDDAWPRSSVLFNSIIYYNSGGNYGEGTVLNYCLTSPLPTNGLGNITGLPLFMDMAAGDFQLREDSPCIDAGTNLFGLTRPITNQWEEVWVVTYAYDATDILGNTRFIDGNGDRTVAWDIGAYEFNSFKPPRFAVQPQQTADGWVLNLTGAPDKWVHLQRSENLRDWEDIWSGFMGPEGIQQVHDGDLGPNAMFYRVVVP